MPPLRFCANITMMFTQEAPNCLLDRYALAAQAGFKAVECAFPYEFTKEEVADVKKKFGLQQILINAEPGENGKGFAAIPGKEDRFRESLIKSLEYCKALDCKKLHLMSGLTKVDQESKSAMMNNLRSAIPLLEESGVVGLIEPINPYSVPGYFLHDFELAESIVKELNSPFLRLQLDVFHLQFLRGDLTNSINRFLPITGHIQIAQVPERHEPDSTGEINYAHIFGILLEANYAGWIGLEYFPKSGTRNGLEWIDKYGFSL